MIHDVGRIKFGQFHRDAFRRATPRIISGVPFRIFSRRGEVAGRSNRGAIASRKSESRAGNLAEGQRAALQRARFVVTLCRGPINFSSGAAIIHRAGLSVVAIYNMEGALIKILRFYALQLRLILSGKLTATAAGRRKNRQYNYPALPNINIAST